MFLFLKFISLYPKIVHLVFCAWYKKTLKEKLTGCNLILDSSHFRIAGIMMAHVEERLFIIHVSTRNPESNARKSDQQNKDDKPNRIKLPTRKISIKTIPRASLLVPILRTMASYRWRIVCITHRPQLYGMDDRGWRLRIQSISRCHCAAGSHLELSCLPTPTHALPLLD